MGDPLYLQDPEHPDDRDALPATEAWQLLPTPAWEAEVIQSGEYVRGECFRPRRKRR